MLHNAQNPILDEDQRALSFAARSVGPRICPIPTLRATVGRIDRATEQPSSHAAAGRRRQHCFPRSPPRSGHLSLDWVKARSITATTICAQTDAAATAVRPLCCQTPLSPLSAPARAANHRRRAGYKRSSPPTRAFNRRQKLRAATTTDSGRPNTTGSSLGELTK